MRYNINKKKKLNLKNLVFLFYMFLSVLIMNLYKYKYIILVIIIFFYLYLKYKSKIIEGWCIFNCGGKSRKQLEREARERDRARERERVRQQTMRNKMAASLHNIVVARVSIDKANALKTGAAAMQDEFCAARIEALDDGSGYTRAGCNN